MARGALLEFLGDLSTLYTEALRRKYLTRCGTYGYDGRMSVHTKGLDEHTDRVAQRMVEVLVEDRGDSRYAVPRQPEPNWLRDRDQRINETRHHLPPCGWQAPRRDSLSELDGDYT